MSHNGSVGGGQTGLRLTHSGFHSSLLLQPTHLSSWVRSDVAASSLARSSATACALSSWVQQAASVDAASARRASFSSSWDRAQPLHVTTLLGQSSSMMGGSFAQLPTQQLPSGWLFPPHWLPAQGHAAVNTTSPPELDGAALPTY